MMPNQSPEPTAVGAVSSAVAVHAASRRWLSFFVRHRRHTLMTYDILFAGVGGTVLGTLLGSWLSSRLTYGFQKRLLEQQLAFQKEQAVADAELRRKIYEEWRGIFVEFRNMLNTRLGRLASPAPQSDDVSKR